MTAYTLLKFVHVVAAIVAVGSNATYGVWLARATREPQHLRHILGGVKAVDDRLANPSYAALLVTGLLMVWVSEWRITTPWILTSLVLYAAIVVLGFAYYSPLLRRQIEALDAHGADSSQYRSVAARATQVGLLLSVIVIVIVFLMVTKPALW